MEAEVPERAACPLEAAASSSNSTLPAFLVILPNDHHLLQIATHPVYPEDVRNFPKP